MPHVAFVSLVGLRVGDEELASRAAELPGLAARADALAELPALGLLTLAGDLSEEWNCSYHEAAAVDDDLVQELVRLQPALVAVSALTASVLEAYELARRLRAENIRTVLGGLHATACSEEAGQHFNAVVAGEGEMVWRQVLDDVASGKLQPFYEAVRTTAPLDWPTPRFDLAATGRRRRWTLQTQRGCPLACDFCAASRLLSRFREKPVAHVKSELKQIAEIDPRAVIELADDNTFAGDRDAHQLIDTLAEAAFPFFTEVDWRLGERFELLPRLAAAGCVQVLVGIESLVFRYPGMGDKADELKRIMNAIENIQNAGIAVHGCFIVGAEGETADSIRRLREFIMASELADVQLTLQTPFPGTALHRRLQQEGRLLENVNWSSYTLLDVTYHPDKMPADELQTRFRELVCDVHQPREAKRRAVIRRSIWRRHRSVEGIPL